MPSLHLATFRCDVTPPVGHPLCGGWIEPVRGVDDPLYALGVILLGAGRPVVLCAVDWTALRNDAYRLWRQALADATHTVPENVAVQCIHQHNAPFADVGAQRMLDEVHGPPSLDLKFFNDVVKRVADAAKESLAHTRRFNHAGVGKAKVEQVASNRRVLGPDGKVKYTRTSATKDAKARAEPEGLIDPWLRTLSFWDGDRPFAALHYYATHPMSYYGDGRVSADFCGLARQKLQEENSNVFQIYFTGCAGNITAGKYNDGAKANRSILRDRMCAGMKDAWQATGKFAVDGFNWKVEPVRLSPRSDGSFGEAASRQTLDDAKATAVKRNNAAFQLAWHARKDRPIDLTCLEIGRARALHLPGESFIEYQLFAQQQRPDLDVFVAGYGDDGTGYIPTAKGYLEGGYEPTVALTAPDSEATLRKGIAKLLGPAERK
jgi:hypothetical protein